MAFGIAGSLFKGLSGADKDIYGTKPVVPQFDPLSSYRKTIRENIQLAPEAMQLADITNRYNLGTRTALFEQLMPGYQSTLSTVAANQASRARGELPKDVLENLNRQSAAYRVSSGVGRAPMANLRDLRNYGLTSLDLSRGAESDIANWLRTLSGTSMPEAVDIRDYSINPAARFQDEFARDKLAADILASPDPAERGQFDSSMALLGMVLSAYGGGAGYTGQRQPSTISSGGGGSPAGGSWWSRMFRPSSSPSAYQTGSYTGPGDSGPFY